MDADKAAVLASEEYPEDSSTDYVTLADWQREKEGERGSEARSGEPCAPDQA